MLGGSGSGGKGGDWGSGKRDLGKRMGKRGTCWSGAGSGVCFLEFPKARVPRPLPPGGGSLREAPPALPTPERTPNGTSSCAGRPAWGLPGAFSAHLRVGRKSRAGGWVASQVRTRGRAEEGAAGWGWREEPRKLHLAPGGLACSGGEFRAGGGAVLPEIQGPLALSPSAPHRSLPHLEELWNVRPHLVNAQVAVRGG